MPRRILTVLPFVFLLLTGCGTRSIVVPVRRPAAISFQGCSHIAIARLQAAPQPDSLTVLLNDAINRTLTPALTGSDASRFVPTHRPAHALITPHGTVALDKARQLARGADADCMLVCELLESSYSEQVLAAEIQSSKTPGRVKRVRQGRATAVCRVLLVDVRDGSIPFVEVLSTDARHEMHAVDDAPPPLSPAAFADDLAQQIVETLRTATTPIMDRELVTFLVDGDYPLIEDDILHAEEGRWDEATVLLRRLIDEHEGSEQEDILWYDLGLTLQYQQDFSSALAAFRRARSLHDRSRYLHAIDALLRAEQEYLDGLPQQ